MTLWFRTWLKELDMFGKQLKKVERVGNSDHTGITLDMQRPCNSQWSRSLEFKDPLELIRDSDLERAKILFARKTNLDIEDFLGRLERTQRIQWKRKHCWGYPDVLLTILKQFLPSVTITSIKELAQFTVKNCALILVTTACFCHWETFFRRWNDRFFTVPLLKKSGTLSDSPIWNTTAHLSKSSSGYQGEQTFLAHWYLNLCSKCWDPL